MMLLGWLGGVLFGVSVMSLIGRRRRARERERVISAIYKTRGVPGMWCYALSLSIYGERFKVGGKVPTDAEMTRARMEPYQREDALQREIQRLRNEVKALAGKGVKTS